MPAILNGILELIPSAEDVKDALTLRCGDIDAGTDLTKTEFAAALGITLGEVDALFSCRYLYLLANYTDSEKLLPLMMYLNITNRVELFFGLDASTVDIVVEYNFIYKKETDKFDILYTEI